MKLQSIRRLFLGILPQSLPKLFTLLESVMKSCSVSFPLRLIYSVGCVLFFSLLSGFSQTVYEQLVVRNPLPTPNNITSLSYGNGKFLATTDRGGILLSSEDGINWEILETPHPNSLEEITYGNGLYCAASSGSGPVYFSPDLINWTTVTSNNLPSSTS